MRRANCMDHCKWQVCVDGVRGVAVRNVVTGAKHGSALPTTFLTVHPGVWRRRQLQRACRSVAASRRCARLWLKCLLSMRVSIASDDLCPLLPDRRTPVLCGIVTAAVDRAVSAATGEPGPASWVSRSIAASVNPTWSGLCPEELQLNHGPSKEWRCDGAWALAPFLHSVAVVMAVLTVTTAVAARP